MEYFNHRNNRNLKSNGKVRKKRKVIIELTIFQFFGLLVALFLGFLWMFAVGLTIGRNFPQDEGKFSLMQKIVIAMGYKPKEAKEKEKSEPPKPREIQASLNYHQELTKPFIPNQPTQKVTSSSKQKLSSLLPPPPPSQPSIVSTGAERESQPTTVTPPSSEEKYTVLVASFKNLENASKMEQMLKSKGYIVNVEETKVNNETWYRITVGNFDSREVAMKFMAMFNEKERLKGVLIRK